MGAESGAALNALACGGAWVNAAVLIVGTGGLGATIGGAAAGMEISDVGLAAASAPFVGTGAAIDATDGIRELRDR